MIGSHRASSGDSPSHSKSSGLTTTASHQDPDAVSFLITITHVASDVTFARRGRCQSLLEAKIAGVLAEAEPDSKWKFWRLGCGCKQNKHLLLLQPFNPPCSKDLFDMQIDCSSATVIMRVSGIEVLRCVSSCWSKTYLTPSQDGQVSSLHSLRLKGLVPRLISKSFPFQLDGR